MKKAFTTLELLITLALLGIVLSFSIVFAQVSQLRSDLTAQSASLASYLRLAQQDASSGKDGLSHGIHLETEQYVIFSGDTYNELDPTNTVMTLPPTLNLSNITLNGGGADLIFTSPFGETANDGSFDLVSTSSNQSIPFTVTSYGQTRY